MGNPQFATVELTMINCANCGITFGVPRRFESDRRTDHKSFFCPSGHSNYYPGKSDEERLRERVEQLERARDNALARANEAQLEIRARKGVATKLRKKLAHGECPCCRKTFKTLAKHMAAKHPGYEQDDSQ